MGYKKTYEELERELSKLKKQVYILQNDLDFTIKENKKLTSKLIKSNRALLLENKEKEKRAEELIIANVELAFQKGEKGKQFSALKSANIELDVQNEEKRQRAAAALISKVELAFQNEEKRQHDLELIVNNKKLSFQKEKKGNPAEELILAKIKIAIEGDESEKLIAELIIANLALSLQEELSESKDNIEEYELKFQNLFDNSLIAKSITKLDGLLQVNKAFCDILGYSKNELETIKWQELTYPEDIEKSEQMVQLLLKGTIKRAHFEKRYVHKNGTIVCAKIATFLQRDTNNNPEYFITAFNDITELKQAEKEREQFFNFFKVSPDIMVISDPIGVFKAVNPATTKLLGYSEEELLLKPFIDFVHPEDKQKTLDEAGRNNIGYTLNFENRYKRKDGSYIILSWCSCYNKEEGITYATARDVTKERMIEAELYNAKVKAEESEEKFRRAFVSAPFPIMIHAEDGAVVSINQAWTDLTGYSHEEIPTISDWCNKAHPKNSTIIKEHIRSLYDSNKIDALDEIEIFTADGRKIVWDFSSAGLGKIDDGKKYVISMAKDVTLVNETRAKLKVSEQKYGNIIENALVGVYETDMEGNILFVNKYLIERGGFKDINSLMSRNASESYFIPTQRDAIIKRLKKEGSISNLEIDFLDANNKVIHCLLSLSLSNNTILGLILDITHKKKAEEELIKLSRAVEQSPVSIVITNLDGNIEYANPKVTEVTGFELSELIGQNPRVFQSGEKSKEYYANLWDTISSGNEWFGEFHNKKKNGELYWEFASISPIIDVEGKITHYLAVKEDITKQKELIYNLEEIKNKALDGQESYKALFDTIGDAIYIQDDEAKFLDVNKGVLNMYGYSREELIGNTPKFLSASGKNNMSAVFKSFNKVKQGTPQVFEFWGKRKNGEEFPKIVSQYKGTYFGRDVVITVARDITEHKQAEDALKDSELRFKALHNASFGGIAIHYRGIIADCNQGLSDVTGYTVDELIGMNGLMLIAKKSRKQVINNIRIAFDKPYEAFGLRKNGEEYPMRLQARNIPYKGKEARSVEFRDITKEKQTEIELIEAKEQAEQSDRLKSAFLANMSHEIRTPMNGILGFAELLKSPELTGENQQKYISIIEKSGERMLNIINDIVNISKIESGLVNIHLEETSFNEQAAFIYTFFKPEAESKGLQFLLKNENHLSDIQIYTDREKVYAILTNLVKNAIKYTENGTIELSYYKKDNFLEFYVKDSGIGIPKDRQEAIFERFIQADITDKMAKQGAGLGLSITKAYVEMLGGQLWLESEEGKGSIFYFTLPYQTKTITEETKKIEVLAPAEKSSTKKLKILIADDDESSEIFLSIALEEFAKEIIIAKNGLEAVKICRDNPDIDLVFMDIQMPKMDGYEATKQIRKFNTQVSIIAQTAYALTGDREKAMEVGCNDYISKPIKIDVLHELISLYLLVK
ncbi:MULTISPECIES: PAS domain-containing hybrid sensor histidine kinase/response regulator [Flavobacteriaceae]|uniref:histidine kinase n=2 Tax=Flavobacteriaceae TaxID=49546 RepID=A0A4Y8AVQ1_9FLAO|nr:MULTISPECIES: PAS domain-containing hybrid sensor histidine kinase/response regulator [Flavobacteriaceae]TEW76559.1 PAS domain S-box protein [Gramella jeungdoensis]GGK54013.1 hypothetical protein GCM10007963_22880 [Lutibacter litoralis]